MICASKFSHSNWLVSLSLSIILVCTASANEVTYTLPALVEKALENSSALEAHNGELAAAHALQTNLSSWNEPEMRLGYGRDTNTRDSLKGSDYPAHKYDASVRISPRNPWEMKATRQKLRSAEEQIALTQTVTAIEIQKTVEALYLESCYSHQQRIIQEQLVELRAAQLEGIEKLLTSGQASLEQSLPAKMKQLDSVMKLQASIREEEEILGQLALLAGVPKETIQLQAPPAMTAEAFQLPFESWKQQAIENRLELDIHDTNIEYIRAEIQAIKATEIPWLKHIQANYRVLNDYGDRDGAGVEIAFSLPFFTGNDGKEKAAYATLNSQQKQRFHTIKMIEVETSNLVDEFKALEQQWNNHRDAIGPMADELRESVDRMAEQNRQSTNAYWDTRIALFELESKELQMMHLYQQLLLKSKATLGTLN